MTIQTFIGKVRDNYNPNPYHNFHHAFHVFHSVHCILRSKSIGFLNSFQVLSVLVAAICHDIDHPGNNNAFEKEVSGTVAALILLLLRYPLPALTVFLTLSMKHHIRLAALVAVPVDPRHQIL